MPALDADPIRPLFRHCPRCGTEGFNAQPPPALSCAACGFFFFLNPAVASAAIIRDPTGRVLFIRRAKDPFKGTLALPGGFIDKGETAEEALAREVQEELGLELRATRFLLTHPNHYEYRGVSYSVLDLFFLAEVRSLDDLDIDADEVSAYELVELAKLDLGEIGFPSHRVALERLRAEAET
jgi:mutator protein MutT